MKIYGYHRHRFSGVANANVDSQLQVKSDSETDEEIGLLKGNDGKLTSIYLLIPMLKYQAAKAQADSAHHNVVAFDDSFKTLLLGKGGSPTITFKQSGEFHFYCEHYKSMVKGKIIVKKMR